MSCYSPNYVIYTDSGFGRFGGKLTQGVLDSYPPGQVVPVPCGRCTGCRMDYGKQWADRMLLEYNTPRVYGSKKALFVTLTYDDEHLPLVSCSDGAFRSTLRKRDYQLFFKRLRKSYSVRYLLCGEYGDNTHRPHYHAVIFGLSVSDFPDSVVYRRDDKASTCLYSSLTFSNFWQNGFCTIADASFDTMCYVSRYVLKKQYSSDYLLDFYKGRQPPFIVSSRHPGIGSDFFDGLDVSSVGLNDGHGVRVISRPRVSLEKLSLTNPSAYDTIKSRRRMLSEDQRYQIEKQTNMRWLDYLMSSKLSLDRRFVNYRNKKL